MSRVLVDLTPGSGAHGGRGIGSYVRGLSAALAAASASLRSSVAVLIDDPVQAPADYGCASARPATRWRTQDVGWLTHWLSASIAMRRTGSDAFHLTDPRAPYPPWRSRRLAVMAYDLIPLEVNTDDGARLHRRLIYRAYLRALQKADRVTAISVTTAAAVSERLGIDVGKVDVIYPVVTAPGAGPAWERPEEASFLFIGVPDRHKQPELAIRALAAYRRRHNAGRLRFIGPLAPRHVERLQALIRMERLTGAVTVEGAVDAAALELAYRSATALLAVSRVEGFGLPPVEAALRGVPVIALDTPIARETVDVTARFVPADPDVIAEAMERPDPPSEPARAILAERYSVSAAARSLVASYMSLLHD